MSGKEFDPKLWAENDMPCKEAMARHLRAQGISTKVNPDKFGIDLQATDGSERLWEVERKWEWAERFTFTTLHIPQRKAKYVNEHSTFCVFNKWLTKLAIVPGSLILSDEVEVVYKDTKFTHNEAFFSIPVKLVQFEDAK